MASSYILVVDDEPDIRGLVQEILQDEGYEVETAKNGGTARDSCRQRRPDLVLLDIWMPDIDGISLLKEWKENTDNSTMGNFPVIMMSGHGSVETAVEATRLGAYDFLEKPLSLAKLLLTVEHALQAHKLDKENQGMRQQLSIADEPVGKSQANQDLAQEIKQIAQHDSRVLFVGEPGSGKSKYSRLLHRLSKRSEQPYIELGVATLDVENSARELFGSEVDGKIYYGLLEQAGLGTLYIDDIGEMDMATQGRLLSTLETGCFHRLGGSESIDLMCRIITATHYSMEQLIAQEQFKSELYFQLNVLQVKFPPLREHCEDVPDLLNYYRDRFVQQEQFNYRNFSIAALNKLRNYPWPGNLLELKNLVQRLLIVSDEENITLEEVESSIEYETQRLDKQDDSLPGNSALKTLFEHPLKEARELFEKAYLEEKLMAVGGSVGKVAQLAGVERTHLYRKMKVLGIDAKKISKKAKE
ncbi:sigma-54-dependent transcriptional regulator [sulfur-oxidizing endosymbiont of Gigantopelta aegis]|uniref:sigma-54-dependent transcriptional regulator n=1 Tax=sulfur-oxidizing endosymbiont of Gigantopelta aegis TaxID=2794934 RepID=UPI0018DAFA7D|nr:sigma-54 dependent transcriptional regulator [sulfur-oxidizing endosymbiont of Gigantopelta aegis]